MDWIKLTILILICQAAGLVGARVTRPALKPWYASLKKPSFTPPNWLFAPAWIMLYFLMAVSCYLIWMKGVSSPGVKMALVIFGVQLILNSLWSFIFFGVKSIFFGLLEILLLWLSIALTIFVFWKISLWAAVLLVPYLAWVTFAFLLNYAIWRLNPKI